MELIVLDTVESTSTYLASKATATAHGTAVMARAQSAGRGQRGNSWEAAPGLNLTLSVLLRPEGLEAASAYLLSEAVSEAAATAIERFIAPVELKLKWPNDLYVADCKLGGILIENSLRGRYVDRTIVGIGVNINQLQFVSDAPNPISMAAVTGRTFDVDEVARAVARAIASATDALAAPEELQQRYASRLWRRNIPSPYTDAATGEHFTATIHSVAPSGIITLELPDGSLRPYAFKEVIADVGKMRKNV